MTVDIVRAVPGDEAEVLRMVQALAVYEGQPEAVQATEESLRGALFGPGANAHAFLARAEGGTVGLALWFHNFSTWTSGKGIYLEDLFVDPSARGLGVGRALFQALAAEARATGCQRIDWAVLDWNETAMGFYRRIGGRAMSGWQPWRLDGPALDSLAQG